MPMFTKDSTERTDARAMPAEGALSIVAAGMTVVGNIDSNGVVKIEGRVEGTVRSARQVLVGRQGEIRGDVLTREAVIGGRVHGKITATERTEIQATASVEGDIHTKT
ncbi:MAG TPA: polymer-forming cytoskeletal protein, partial [Solirubrobacteraceae bacterium]|nr:polymer-forming cytoskeletal protein [Solirubrobacteraceae bacterium]